MKRLSHLYNVTLHFGAAAALLRIGDRILQTLGFEVFKVMHYNRALDAKIFTSNLQLSFRQLSVAEVKQYAAEPDNRIPVSFVDRIASGRHLCMATFCDSRLAAYGWYALGSIDADENAGVAMSYPADTACVYRFFTHPDFRGQLIHGAVRPYLYAALAEHGITKIVGIVSWTNWPSRHLARKVGYRDLGHLISVGPRRHRFWIAPREAARFGIKFGDKATMESCTTSSQVGSVAATS